MKLFRNSPRSRGGETPSVVGGSPVQRSSAHRSQAGPLSPARSLGAGSFAFSKSSGSTVTQFVATPTKSSLPSSSSSSSTKKQLYDTSSVSSPNRSSSKSLLAIIKDSSEKVLPRRVFHPRLSSFLRVADLVVHMSGTNDPSLKSSTASPTDSSCSGNSKNSSSNNGTMSILSVPSTECYTEEDMEPYFHHASTDPPPGILHDPDEQWVALDDGQGQHAPIAPFAVQALVHAGQVSAWNETMWNPDHKTIKFIKAHASTTAADAAWHEATWHKGQAVVTIDESSSSMTSATDRQQVLVWSGAFSHGLYGSDLPAVRAAGIINMPPVRLMELLVDSKRVKEYNPMSQGRSDLLVLQEGMEGPFGGITKVMKSESKPPLVRKTLEFTSILHARPLDGVGGGSSSKTNTPGGYLIVTRAVTNPSQSSVGAITSEILMGVNLLLGIEGNPNSTLMVTVNHIRSPLVPMMIAKRLGLQAAVNFIHDLRKCC